MKPLCACSAYLTCQVSGSGILLRPLPPRSQQPCLGAQGSPRSTPKGRSRNPKSELRFAYCPNYTGLFLKLHVAHTFTHKSASSSNPAQPILTFCPRLQLRSLMEVIICLCLRRFLSAFLPALLLYCAVHPELLGEPPRICYPE